MRHGNYFTNFKRLFSAPIGIRTQDGFYLWSSSQLCYLLYIYCSSHGMQTMESLIISHMITIKFKATYCFPATHYFQVKQVMVITICGQHISNPPNEDYVGMLSKLVLWISCIIYHINSLWHHMATQNLAQVTACCQTALSHYLNQCWQFIVEILWHSPIMAISRGMRKMSILYTSLKMTNSILQLHLLGTNELITRGCPLS